MTLEEHVEKLLALLEPPAHRAIRIVELTRSEIGAKRLDFTAEQLATVGLTSGTMILAIELPGSPIEVPSGTTSVNYSGLLTGSTGGRSGTGVTRSSCIDR